MLIQIRNKEALSLPALFRLALKSIYDHKNLTFTEEKQLHESVINWKNHLEVKRDIGFSAEDETNEYQLLIVADLLQKDMDGMFDKRKELFARHQIDYKKFYKLPEAYDVKDYIKGQATLKEHMRTNPEDYN